MTYSLKYMGFRLRQKTAGGNFFMTRAGRGAEGGRAASTLFITG